MGQHLGRNAVRGLQRRRSRPSERVFRLLVGCPAPAWRDLPANSLVKMSTKEHVQRTMAPSGSSDQREPRRVCLTLDGATVAGTAASSPYGTIDYMHSRL